MSDFHPGSVRPLPSALRRRWLIIDLPIVEPCVERCHNVSYCTFSATHSLLWPSHYPILTLHSSTLLD